MKLTPWFSGDQKPVRVGVYERDYPDGFPAFSHWDGAAFCMAAGSVEDAHNIAPFVGPSVHQSFPWRGVLKD